MLAEVFRITAWLSVIANTFQTPKRRNAMSTKSPPRLVDATDTFNLITDTEDDLEDAFQFARTIAIMTETMDEDVGSPVQRVAWEIANRIQSAEEKRGKLFRLNHPDRTSATTDRKA
jgi:hypothetical protein